MSDMLQAITELSGTQERRPGGHNWPDLEIVIDPAQTTIENDAIYLLQIQDRDPTVKRCRDEGSCIRLMPALATIHGVTIETVLGKKMPVTGIEFTDSIYKRHITVHGRVVGLWAGDGIAP